MLPLVPGSVSPTPSRVVGRYSLHAEVAHGGMATVHVGRLAGPVGFSRTVAIKRLHPHLARDPEFVAMFMDEARLAARIRHPNVVSIIDVVAEQGELLLVMDYIQGESVSRLLKAARLAGGRVEPRIAVKIMTEVLAGLHAAHEVRSERGAPLGIVHRDVSPQNMLVGVDGVAHLIDFGVAKAAGRIQTTREGQLKGKLAYMAPEQIRGGTVDRRTDIYAAATVLWEILVGRRLFKGDEAGLMFAVLTENVPAPSKCAPDVGAKLDAVVMKALSRDPAERFATAIEMADALEAAMLPCSSREVSLWMQELAAQAIQERAALVAEVESMSHVSVPPRAALSAADVSSASGPRSAEPPDPSSGPAEGHLSTFSTDEEAVGRNVPASSSDLQRGRFRWLGVAASVLFVVSAILLALTTVTASTPHPETSPSGLAARATIETPAAVAPVSAGSDVATGLAPATASSSAGIGAPASPDATAPKPTSVRAARTSSPSPGTAAAPPSPTNSARKPIYTRD
jgi:serine/threonine protein kinase